MLALTPLELACADAARDRDAATGKARRRGEGIVHTPVQLCRFVVEELDRGLRNEGFKDGLCTEGLQIVDPACGTGLFFASLYGKIGFDAPVSLVGMDADEEALARAKAIFSEQEIAWRAGDALSEELEGEGPLAVLGNPPWAGRSAYKSERSEAALEAFRRDGAGARLEERKLGVLSDAYVRFFAWVHEAFEKRGGAFCLISNSSFVDGPVHRGMRGALKRRFELTLTDLGGSSLVARDRGADGNVFGVRPGVVVVAGSRPTLPTPHIRYARIKGSAEEKLAALGESIAFDEVPSNPPMYRFAPTEGSAFPDAWRGVHELFPFHAEGIQTNRDAVVIDADKDALIGRMQAFALHLALPAVDLAEAESGHYDPERARRNVREALRRAPDGEGWIRPVAYRPFDRRYFASLKPLCHRPRPALQQAMDASSFALITVRKDRGGREWSHLFASRDIPDNCLLSARSSCRARAFPTHQADGSGNLSDEGLAWSKRLDPEASHAGPLLAYAAAILASPAYRRAFSGVLALDYPRLPAPDADGEALMAHGQTILEACFEGPAGGGPAIGHWHLGLPEGARAALEAADAIVAAKLR